MSNTINLEEVQLKLYERLKPSGWADKLKGFILSQDFMKILETLLKESNDGKRFTPVMKQLFKAFEECPYDKLKVVMMGQDPYPYPGVASGVSFDCSNTGKVEASLRYMFKEIEETVHPEGYSRNPDLTRWSNQGFLMLNTALTTTVNKVGQHYILWQPFLAYLFDILNFSNPGLIYVFMGKKAQEWAGSIPDNNHVIFTSHPASAAHSNLDKWSSDDMFNKVSKLLETEYNYKMIW